MTSATLCPLYRCDRDRVSTNKSDGGGVLVAILKTLRPVEVALNDRRNGIILNSYIEQLAVDIPGRNLNYHIVTVAYIPSKGDATTLRCDVAS